MTNEPHIRVLRVLEYVGPRDKIEATIARSIHGEKHAGGMVIKATTVGINPEGVSTTITPEDLHYVNGQLNWLLTGPIMTALRLASTMMHMDHQVYSEPSCSTCQATEALRQLDKLYGLPVWSVFNDATTSDLSEVARE